MKLNRITLLSVALTTYNASAEGLELQLQPNAVKVEFSSNSIPDSLQQVEWSTNLVDWQPLARNFNNNWQNVFPNTEQIDEDSGVYSHSKDLSNDQVFYRLSTATTTSPNITNSVARFLQQATFGPSLTTIQQFPGIDDPSFDTAPYSNHANWIQSQIDLPITSHRAFFRKRSNPAFIDNPAATENGTSLFQVAYDSSLNHPAFNYFINAQDQQPLEGVANNLGQFYSFTTWTSANGSNTTKVEQNRYNDWLAKGPLTWNPNDAIRGGGTLIGQKKTIWYTIAITAEDQLRQRVAWALSQIFVLGEEGFKHPQATERFVKYYDIFVRNAFGNYRDILGEVTYSPQMGYYLTYEKNTKEGGEGDNFPDENYAREVMQLFTIGLWELNEDGTFKSDADGNLIPTYDNDDITQFAKVFTGLDRPDSNNDNNYPYYPNFEQYQNQNYLDIMKVTVWRHDTSVKTNLYGDAFEFPINYGYNTPQAEAVVRDEIDYVLDHLFNHTNTPPFVARQLIQRFTGSNPSPTYINDISQVFKSGQFTTGTHTFGSAGDRGNLEAVVAAILLHPEARTHALKLDATYGKLREPLIKLISIARAFDITSLQTYGLFPFDNLYDKLGQEPYEYPNVFNFYRPDFQPNGEILEKNLNAPEFQPLTDVTTIGLANSLRWLIYEGIKRNTPDTGIGSKWYAQAELNLNDQIALATDSNALLDQLSTLITAGRLTDENRSVIKNYIDSLPSNNNSAKEKRVQDAIWLMILTPEFNTLY